MGTNGSGHWVTLDSAVTATGKSSRTIRRWVAKDKLPHKHEEGRLWVDLSGLDLPSDRVVSDNGQDVSDTGQGADTDNGQVVSDNSQPVSDNGQPVSDTGPDVSDNLIRIARLEAELDGLNKLNDRLEQELESWKGQAAALTAALSDHKLIEAEASPTGSAHPERPWWQFWK